MSLLVRTHRHNYYREASYTVRIMDSHGVKTLAAFDMAEDGARIVSHYAIGITPEEVEAILEFCSGQETKEAISILKFFLEEYV